MSTCSCPPLTTCSGAAGAGGSHDRLGQALVLVALSASLRRLRSRRLALTVFLTMFVLFSYGIGLGHPQSAATHIQTISMEGSPSAVALDPSLGRAVVADDGNATVSIIDLAGARVLRTVRVGDPRLSASLALAVDTTTHHVFVAVRGDVGQPSVVQMLDSASGARLATVRVGDRASAVAIDARQGYVFVANEGDGTVSMLDARRGALLRTMHVGGEPVALAVDAHAARVAVVSVAPLWGTTHMSGGGMVSLLDTRSGRLLRRVPVGDGSSTLAIDARTGRLFVVNWSGGTVSVLDVRSGAAVRTVVVGAAPAALAVDERRRRVFVVDAFDGTVRVLDGRSGAVLATRRVDPAANPAFPLSYALAVDEAHDRVYLSSWGDLEWIAGSLTLRGPGRLYVLDARTGKVRQTLSVGVAPDAVASGRGWVVVANAGGWVARSPESWPLAWLRRVGGWLPWFSPLATPAPGSVLVPGSVSLIS